MNKDDLYCILLVIEIIKLSLREVYGLSSSTGIFGILTVLLNFGDISIKFIKTPMAPLVTQYTATAAGWIEANGIINTETLYNKISIFEKRDNC